MDVNFDSTSTLPESYNYINNMDFNPEFLNRLDDIIFFETLDGDSIKKIVHIFFPLFFSKENATIFQD